MVWRSMLFFLNPIFGFWPGAETRVDLSRCPDQILQDDLVVPAGNGVPNVDQGTGKKECSWLTARGGKNDREIRLQHPKEKKEGKL